MNLHKNARSCPNSRAIMVRRVLVDKQPVKKVAREHGVSVRTVYKWVERFCRYGEAGLQDGSSKPLNCRHALGQDWIDTNGKAERFIQTLLREWAYFRAYKTSNERLAVLPIYL